MQATPELRFVERDIFMGHSDTEPEFKTVRILQQKWFKQVFNESGEAYDTDQFEWRDVPLEKEE